MFERLKKKPSEIKTLSSSADGAEAFVLKALLNNAKNDILFVAADGAGMEQTASILRYISPETEVLTFPAWDTVPYDRISPNSSIIAARVDVLAHLASEPSAKKPRIIVSSVGAVLQKLPTKKIFLFGENTTSRTRSRRSARRRFSA